ncbi:MAG: hypothetical protein JO252_02830 [Planctomycetaceae bacterium]|nr:hypothetical protein [Planctomycetaceae bacterium]
MGYVPRHGQTSPSPCQSGCNRLKSYAPWYIVPADDKRRARLNCISHLLSLIPYEKVPRKKVKLPARSMKDAYDDRATLESRRFVPARY